MAWDTDQAGLWLSNDEPAYIAVVTVARTASVDELAVYLAEHGPDLITGAGARRGSIDWAEVDWREIAETFQEE